MSDRPLVYQWIAHYNDGTSYPQFDTESYEENSFIKIDKDKLIKFGIYPFKKDFAYKVSKKQSVVSLGFLPIYEINIENEERLIHYRQVFISQETFHICQKCKKEFKFSYAHSFKIKLKDSKLGIKMDEVCPVCPHCGAKDYYKCNSCGKVLETFNESSFGMCPDCDRSKGYLERKNITSGSHSREKRWIDYYLGKQSTIQGRNVKFILKIKENGDCEVL